VQFAEEWAIKGSTWKEVAERVYCSSQY